MTHKFLQVVRVSMICCLIVSLVAPQLAQAQSKIVQPAELKNALEKAATAREHNLSQVRTFFSSKPVRAALAKSSMSPERVDQAVRSLSSDDLAKLAERTQKIQRDFAAGAMSNQDLTYIVIALAAAVLVLIVVAAD